MKFLMMALLMLASLVGNSVFAAVPNHSNHGQPHVQQNHAGGSNTFQMTRQTDGYLVSFHVMPVVDGMRSNGGHSLMVKLERNGQVIRDAKINSRVIFPDKSQAQQLLLRSGDWYTANYAMQGERRHQVMVLFQTADGQMHRTGVYYPR